MSSLFGGCHYAGKFPFTSKWDISKVTDMNYSYCDQLYYLPDILNWNISNITNIKELFSHSNLDYFPDISKLDRSKATYMSSLFAYINIVTFPSISNWNTSNFIDMSCMINSVHYDILLIFQIGMILKLLICHLCLKNKIFFYINIWKIWIFLML